MFTVLRSSVVSPTRSGSALMRGAAGLGAGLDPGIRRPLAKPLYTPDERRRRDASPWTIVQGVLAPLQLLICAASFACIVHYLLTGQGLGIATGSVLVKTVALYAIMITGSIWEKAVFGRYLFAPAFFWEDMVSMLVLALHTAYVAALLTDALAPHALLGLALVAYASYAINAGQFLLKLRAARRDAVGSLALSSERLA